MPNQPLDKNDPLKGKKTGKWTKYGGAVNGMVKEAIKETWYCQVCGSENPEELKPFLYELYPGDFIRVCNLCINDMSHQKQNNTVTIYKRTVKIFRTSRDY